MSIEKAIALVNSGKSIYDAARETSVSRNDLTKAIREKDKLSGVQARSLNIASSVSNIYQDTNKPHEGAP